VKHPLHRVCLLAFGLWLGVWTAASAGEGRGGHGAPPPRPEKSWGFGSPGEGRADFSESNDLFVAKLVDHEGGVELETLTEHQLNRRLAHLKERYLKALAEWEAAQKLAQQAGEKSDQPKPTKPDYKFVKVKGWKNAEELLAKLRRQQAEEEHKKRKEEAAKGDAPKTAAAKADTPTADPPKETASAPKSDTSKESDAILDRIQKVLDSSAPAPKP